MTMHTHKLQFADPKEQEDLPREILVGSDHYWKIVNVSPPLRISPSVVLLPSNLGWILSGNRSGISANVAAVTFLHPENPRPLPETDIKRFWDLDDWHHKNMPKDCVGAVTGQGRRLATILVSIKIALNSRPITQDNEDAFTPANFLWCKTDDVALHKSHGNLKTHQRPKRMPDDLWRRWEKECLMELRSFHLISHQKGRSGKVLTGDIVLLQEDGRPRHMWMARVEELMVGRDGATTTAVRLGANETVPFRPIQLVIQCSYIHACYVFIIYYLVKSERF